MSGHRRGEIGRILFYAAAVAALAVDQASKAIARSRLVYGNPVDVIPGIFSLRLAENKGAAFGSLGSWPWLLVIIGIIAIVAIAGLRKERSKSKPLAISLGLLLGGAASNLIDRIMPGNDVTDFLDFSAHIGGRIYTWPTFNLADIAITVGVILLAYHVVFIDKPTGEESTPSLRKSK